jgi:gluconate 5-dehydrogenase
MTTPTSLPAWLDLGGAVAVVTGGGTHLGRAMATALGELGAQLYLVGRRVEVVEETAEQLRAAGLAATAWSADASDDAAMTELVDAILERHGRLDVMVCNAGGRVGESDLPNLSLEDLEGTLRQHVGTTLISAQAAARAMIPRRQGAIITVGSIHGTLGSDKRRYQPGFRRSPVSYHAAKGGIVNLTRALACEFGEYGVTVNCVSPGQFPKDGMDEATRELQREGVPLGRLGVPEDLQGAVAMFASPAGRWTSGQNLTVDGGWSAW